MKKRTAGFSLIELLIAGALLVVILGVLGALYASTQRAYQTNRTVTAASGQLRSVIQAIQYDTSMAGFLGVGPGFGGCTITEGLDLVLGSASEYDEGRSITSLTSEYCETRYTEGNVTQRTKVRYELGSGALQRTLNDDAPVVAAREILDFSLVECFNKGGTVVDAHTCLTTDYIALTLRLDYMQGKVERNEKFTISLLNPGLPE